MTLDELRAAVESAYAWSACSCPEHDTTTFGGKPSSVLGLDPRCPVHGSPPLVERAPMSRRDALVLLRGRLVDELDATHKPGCECECGPVGDARVLAALSKELRAVVAELEALPIPEGKSASGDLRERVAVARRAASAGVHPSPDSP